MRLVLLAAAASLLGGCFLDIDYDNTHFACSDGVCPDGFACVDGTCVVSSAGLDGGGGDASGSDAGPPDGATATMTCDEQFGAALAYTLCSEQPATCEFFVHTDVATACNDICPLYGAECMNSFDATEGTECTREEEGACTATHTGQICICTRS